MSEQQADLGLRRRIGEWLGWQVKEELWGYPYVRLIMPDGYETIPSGYWLKGEERVWNDAPAWEVSLDTALRDVGAKLGERGILITIKQGPPNAEQHGWRCIADSQVLLEWKPGGNPDAEPQWITAMCPRGREAHMLCELALQIGEGSAQ